MTLRIVCAWCQRVVQDGSEPTSHGICDECLAVQHEQIAMLQPSHEEIQMRRQLEQVLEAFLESEKCRPADAIWTDGDSIFSYNTCLLSWVQTGDDEKAYVINGTRYSPTTTRYQNDIIADATRAGIEFVIVQDIPRGASPADLIAAYRSAQS